LLAIVAWNLLYLAAADLILEALAQISLPFPCSVYLHAYIGNAVIKTAILSRSRKYGGFVLAKKMLIAQFP